MRRLVRLFALLAVATACLPVAPASALPFPVKSTADDSSTGTLRWAVEEANDRAGADSIPIEVTGTIYLEEALPAVEDDVSIEGPGADLLTIRRNGLSAFRILDFAAGVTATLSGVSVSNGLASLGGGIRNKGDSLTLTGVVVTGNDALESVGGVSATALGGGIYSPGSLTLRESTVRGNTATAEGHDFFVNAKGGGVYSSGPLTVDRSTISENEVRAVETAEEVFAEGGGLQAIGEAVTIERSTISDNSVLAGEGINPAIASGGGIQGNGLNIDSSTITGNRAEGEDVAGANLDIANTSTLRNTIISNPQGEAESCPGPLVSGGFNLDEDASCGLEQATDLNAVVAGLDPVLKSNGGPTPTHALLAGSPAIDRGNAFGSPVDQRNLPRPSDFSTIGNSEGGDGSDIGAFELQVPPPSPVLVASTSADRQAPNTRIVSGPPRVTYKRLAKFRFASTEPQSTFQCKVDKRRWRGCANPAKRKVRAGAKHVFKVRAIDRFGNVDPTPARFGWRVKALGN